MWKKLVAPVIIVCILVIYLLFWVFVCFSMPIHFLLKIFLTLIPIGLICVSIHVLIERYHEIRSGEEDDLRKY